MTGAGTTTIQGTTEPFSATQTSTAQLDGRTLSLSDTAAFRRCELQFLNSAALANASHMTNVNRTSDGTATNNGTFDNGISMHFMRMTGT